MGCITRRVGSSHSDVMITRKESEINMELNRQEAISSLKGQLEQLLSERKELKLKLSNAELKLSGTKIEHEYLKEQIEQLSHLQKQENIVNYSNYYTVLNSNTTVTEKKSLITDILKANAKQMYKYFGPLVVAKNKELKELKLDIQQKKQTYEGIMNEHTSNYENRIKAYQDTVIAARGREQSLQQQLDKLREDHKVESSKLNKEIKLMRNQLNSRKIEIEERDVGEANCRRSSPGLRRNCLNSREWSK